MPAAGIGQRFGGDRPKQYLDLLGKPIIVRTLECLLAHPAVGAVVVALAHDDTWWQPLRFSSEKALSTTLGGRDRARSVQAGLRAIEKSARPQDWVMVHDAARPCLHPDDISRLIDAVEDDPVGGILALPVSDTLKRGDACGRIAETVDRADLWQAQTPQMFRLGALRVALDAALSAGVAVTDEASAMEWAGHAPRLVAGRTTNIKITREADLRFAESVIRGANEHG